MHRNAMILAAASMSSSIVLDTLPPVGYEQSLRPERRHGLDFHPQDIELVLDTEAHVGLRDDDLPNPFDLEDVLAYVDARKDDIGAFDLFYNWILPVRAIRGRAFAVAA